MGGIPQFKATWRRDITPRAEDIRRFSRITQVQIIRRCDTTPRAGRDRRFKGITQGEIVWRCDTNPRAEGGRGVESILRVEGGRSLLGAWWFGVVMRVGEVAGGLECAGWM
ncbi:hypothetical protein ACWEN6_35155 [Sphaerisporangium sp. NPDC004334]